MRLNYQNHVQNHSENSSNLNQNYNADNSSNDEYSSHQEIDSNNNNVCRISNEDIVYPLYVRTRKYGDKMYLKKVNGSKRVKDIFIDAKIPIEERDMWPIVVDSCDKVIWIPGIKKSKFTKQKNESYDIILKYD